MIDGLADILADFTLSDGSPAINDPAPVRDIFAVQSRKGWDKSLEARCNFDYRPRLTRRAGVWFLSLWQKSLMGRTLTEIKSDPAEIPHFADAVSDFLLEALGSSLHAGHWCICTTPKRRHKERNFATLVSMEIAAKLGIPFYEDVAFCRSRQRVNAVFDLNILPEEPNVIIFDDFVTTGSTLAAMSHLLSPLGKNILFVTGINNKL
ncbi:MAG: phosphoribosyltransferase [Muribaculaceae bacterium]|nr:phosphoribosyltransferase [Muribaculaceae bacterium]